MPGLLERSADAPLRVGGDESAARAQLRRQIGRLELELAGLFAEAFPRVEIDCSVPAAGAGRVLDLGELERVRDALAGRVGEAQLALRQRDGLETDNRDLLERMLADPAAYKGLRVYNRDVGVGGCGYAESRPRFGLLGMLMGWWRVKISSGCPL